MSSVSSGPEIQTRQTAWAMTWKLVTDLWPGWAATDDQQRMWERLLAWRHPETVRAAIEQVYSEKTTSYPKPGWVLEILKGKTPLQVAPKRYEISDEEIADIQRQHREMADDLMKLPAEYLAELVEVARCTAISPTKPKELPADVNDWPSALRGMTWAAWKKATTV